MLQPPLPRGDYIPAQEDPTAKTQLASPIRSYSPPPTAPDQKRKLHQGAEETEAKRYASVDICFGNRVPELWAN
jgi:hypothetical protein